MVAMEFAASWNPLLKSNARATRTMHNRSSGSGSVMSAALHADRLHRVEHVVEVAREQMDVLALERRDERPVEPLEDLVGDEVGFVFDVLELAGALVESVERPHELVQLIAALADQRGLLAEQD